jgi:protein-tyrosine phosphatase
VSPFRVLFVCVGNVCRSPLGERLLIARLPPDGFEVASAGIGALVGAPMSPEAAAELAAYGGDAERFTARQLRPDLVEVADLVLAATVEIREKVLAETPRALGKTFTVREFAGLLDDVPGTPTTLVAHAGANRSRSDVADLDVPDPFRRGARAHATAAALMAEAVERIATALSAAPSA